MKLLLVGDVMIGRAIDQILPNSVPPHLYESYVKDARDYIAFAIEAGASINGKQDYKYIWGDALKVISKHRPNLRIINLETALTTSEEFWPNKEVLYRSHPSNVATLNEFKVDFAALANNHLLDWGYTGLKETISTLKKAKISFSGAGKNLKTAIKPAKFTLGGMSVEVLSVGSISSGIPTEWAAGTNKPGLVVLEQLAKPLEDINNAWQNKNSLKVLSIHWGGNWGYEVESWQKQLAYALINQGVDVIHGHSSHHFKGFEVYKGKLILYGCGDFINDYEGIMSPLSQQYRDDLALAYLPSYDSSARLNRLDIEVFKIFNFRLNTPSAEDVVFVADRISKLYSGDPLKLKVEGSRLIFTPA